MLAAAHELSELVGHPKGADALKRQVSAAGGPEFINDSPETAPSERLLREYPAHRKVVDGPDAIVLFGLARLRADCPHRDEWLTRLETAGR